MGRRERSRRQLAISRRRVEHRRLIERRRQPQRGPIGKEDDDVRMPIGIRDVCAKRIEPLKATDILTGQTSSISQEHSSTSPGVRRIVLNRGSTQNSNASPEPDAIKSLALSSAPEPQIVMNRREVSSEESGRTCVCELAFRPSGSCFQNSKDGTT